MGIPNNPNLIVTSPPPVMEARRWVENATFSKDFPLINVSQAAPMDPPPLALRQAIADRALNTTDSHLYGSVLGMSELREEVATRWSAAYGGQINAENVAITSGCNQAFCAAALSLAGPGDGIIIPAPWYFNHKMWLDMVGIQAQTLACGQGMLPDPTQAATLITANTKAILLVTPNNPTGVEYPAGLVREFYNLAKSRGIALVIDETYRDFDSREMPPHDLFQDPNWADTLIQLYSFSKAYRLTGHRVGSLIASTERLVQVEKILDTITICPNQLGQYAALYGIQNLSGWLAKERLEVLDRRAAITAEFPQLSGWKLLGLGAYFAYVEHPFELGSDQLAKLLVKKAATLMLPGTMFAPTLAQGGTGQAERQLRIAFANIDRGGITKLFHRLVAFSP